MGIVSNGVLVKSAVVRQFTPATFSGWPGEDMTFRWGAYSAIYRSHLWVAVLVNKIANAQARLPLKVYERSDMDRPEARDHPYAKLLRDPHGEIDPFLFWLWVTSTLNIYGEAFLVKERDSLGRPVRLHPWHPTGVVDEVRDGRRRWHLRYGNGDKQPIERRDLVHFRTFNPDSLVRGMSPLEPLRSTLENEAGALAASSALFRNGGRPSMTLKHPGALKKQETVDRLRAQWADQHGGVGNWAKPMILEEGMEAQIIQLSNDELQYIESRKLNREECCAAFDVPPPVVHILDRATFSNITEQMRSMYRDTMAPKLRLIESTLETELRDGRLGDVAREPDFGDEVYAEFLMDEVLRGEFEARTAAYSTAINNSWMTPAEVRRRENLPFVEGSDKLIVNAALVPLSGADGEGMSPRELAEGLQKIYLAVGKVISAEEAREILNRGGAGLVGPAPLTEVPALPVRTLMGRLSRHKSLADVDPVALLAGIEDHAPVILSTLKQAADAGDTVEQFRGRLRALTEATA